MCSVSAVVDYYQRRDWQGSPPYPYNPSPVIQPVQEWPSGLKDMLREALEKLDQIDKRLGDLECNEPGKERLKGIIGDWE